MATTLQTLNKVLRGLRQFGLLIGSSDTAITDDYLKMILQFVNEAKEEIEESGHPWEALKSTVTVTLAQGTTEYDLTIAGDADVDTNNRSRLLYENTNDFGRREGFYQSMSSNPQVFDVTDSDEYRLREYTQEKIERLHFTDDDRQDPPLYFSMYVDANSVIMKLWPTPEKTRTLKVRMYIPQIELTDTDITTVITIPDRPIWTKALWKANQERGDELGAQGSTLHMAYLDAHGAAVGNEQSPADQTVFLER